MDYFKENILEYNEEQRRILVDARQLFSAYEDAYRSYVSYRGGMHWKTVKGRQYLFRTLDSRGYGRCLGPRSRETEVAYEEFHRQKAQSRDRLEAIKNRLAFHAGLCKAVGLNRVPNLVARLSRALYFHPSLIKRALIVGTHALYAYESMAGVFLSGRVISTDGLDVLWDAKSRVQVAGLPGNGFLDLLKKVDRSFEISASAHYRAVNKEGFLVELIRPIPREHAWEEGQRTVEDFPEELVAAEIKGLKWLVSCPRVVVVAVGSDGFPFPMMVPDPRAFALHKLWMSGQKKGDPVKKAMDRLQGELVLYLLKEYLPNFPLNKRLLDALPKRVKGV